MQTLIFMGSSREDIRRFPEEARRELGRQLLRIQHGLDPENWKPMKTVGQGVREVRIGGKGQFRALYVTNIGNAVLCPARLPEEGAEDQPERYCAGATAVQANW